MNIEVKHYETMSPIDPGGVGVTLVAKISSVDLLDMAGTRMLEREICRVIAEKYVVEHYAEIVAKLDQNAIASLAIADAGKKIAEEIRVQPVVYRERGDTHNNYSIF
jgi:hypothetical protein